MNYTKDTDSTELSSFSENPSTDDQDQPLPNPRILGALEKNDLLANGSTPVDSSNDYLIRSENLPALDNPKNRKSQHRIKNGRVNKSISYHFRYCFDAIKNLQHDQSNQELVFITCNLSHKETLRLKDSKKGFLNAYVQNLRERINKLQSFEHFICVVEPSQDGSVHTHFVALLDLKEKEILVQKLKKDTAYNDNDVVIKQTYKQKHSAKRNTPAWDFLELDEEYGLNQYHLNDDVWAVELPVNVGAADYISKQLNTKLEGIDSQHWYATREIKRASNELYKKAYKRQQSKT